MSGLLLFLLFSPFYPVPAFSLCLCSPDLLLLGLFFPIPYPRSYFLTSILLHVSMGFPVLDFCLTAPMNHHDQKQLEEERVYFAHTVPFNSSSSKAVWAGTQAGQEPRGRSRGHGGGCCLLAVLSLLSYRTKNHQLRSDAGFSPINH